MPLVRILHSGQHFGPYLLQQSLAEGPLVTTWLARLREDPTAARLVLKTIPLASIEDPDIEETFFEETACARRLEHPSVARLVAAGREAGFLFVAYEWVDGHPLSSLLASSSSEPLPGDVALRLALAMCDAVAAVHGARLVHRAIDPSNLRLSPHGSVCLLDLGMGSLMTQSSATTSRHMVGKFSYLSPEQLWSRPVNFQSDVFSLGLVCYELLVGQHPFRGQHERESIANILAPRPAPSPAHLGVRLGPALEAWLLRAVAKPVEERFASAEELRQGLLGALADTNALASAEELQAVIARRLGRETQPPEEVQIVPTPPSLSLPVDGVGTRSGSSRLLPALGLLVLALGAVVGGWLARR